MERQESSKNRAAHPTVTNESVFLKGMIDAKEKQDAAMVENHQCIHPCNQQPQHHNGS